MAVAYDIKAIPTVYGTRQFRSRLEAKWASFFDLAGWSFEYEPFDLGEWSPDFLLRGNTDVLVEVKPITAFDQDTATRMSRAAEAARWGGELLLLGIAPIFGGVQFESWWQKYSLGWLGESGRSIAGDEKYEFFFAPCAVCVSPGGLPEFHSDTMSYTGRMFGAHYKANSYPHEADWLKRIWDRAANRVQWKPARAAQ